MSAAIPTPVVSPEILAFLFDFNHRALGMNVAGFTHAHSLVPAAPGANCANWTVGHLLHARSLVLTLLGAEPLWSDEQGARFDQETAWPDPAALALPWDGLLADFETSQVRVREALARVTADRLATHHKPESRRPRGMQIHFFLYHEAYHVGQLGLLRRIVGKPGAIQ
jgi:hypothetical protein